MKKYIFVISTCICIVGNIYSKKRLHFIPEEPKVLPGKSTIRIEKEVNATEARTNSKKTKKEIIKHKENKFVS
jgi:hypothetical protein